MAGKWITIRGTRVQIDGKGNITKGPAALKSKSGGSSSNDSNDSSGKSKKRSSGGGGGSGSYNEYTAEPGTEKYHDEKMKNIKNYCDDNFSSERPNPSNPSGKLTVKKVNNSAYEVRDGEGTLKFKMWTEWQGKGDFRVEDEKGLIVSGDDPASAYKAYKKAAKKAYPWL